MTLGDRCDEIVRLIDETLGNVTTPVPARLRRTARAGWPASSVPAAAPTDADTTAPRTGDAA